MDKCFALEEGQSVWFEKDGDVSLLSPDVLTSSQTEVKDFSAPLPTTMKTSGKRLRTG
ncbi:hypothetical protein M3I01_001450 [Marinomonas sp. RSW2]|uniref:Uncharacterized protein n=1 Tax=Marinomonas maritima TaxID=2940935 RepID=A0ABT5W9V0_9GAMM|nr:hypothetical protein [Marinomonas maritima]MDE8601593.1 hypothetical protein [Marinomonas maritima]